MQIPKMRVPVNHEVALNTIKCQCTIKRIYMHKLFYYVLVEVLFLLYILKGYEVTVHENKYVSPYVTRNTNNRILADSGSFKDKINSVKTLFRKKTKGKSSKQEEVHDEQDDELSTSLLQHFSEEADYFTMRNEIKNMIFLDINEYNEFVKKLKEKREIIEETQPELLTMPLLDDLREVKILRFYPVNSEPTSKIEKLISALEYYGKVLGDFIGTVYDPNKTLIIKLHLEFPERIAELKNKHPAALWAIENKLRKMQPLIINKEIPEIMIMIADEISYIAEANTLCEIYKQTISTMEPMSEARRAIFFSLEESIKTKVPELFYIEEYIHYIS